MIKEQSFEDLYGYFFGMLNRGDLDELYARALEAIPTIVSLYEISDFNSSPEAGSMSLWTEYPAVLQNPRTFARGR